jgi:hypothetical protein
VLEKKGIRLVKFHEQVFGFSREVAREVIRNEFMRMIKEINIFAVCIRRMHRRYLGSTNSMPKIYEHINEYILLMIQHQDAFLKERQVVAALDSTKAYILLHGTRARNLMEAKAAMKNVIESMVCLFIKDTPIDFKIMLKYLKKATLYPVYFAKFNNSTAIVISKDNILKQLISKSTSFMRYLGLEQSAEEIQKNVDPTVGFYLIPSISLDIKIEKMREKAQSKSYDIYSHTGIRYLRKVFIQQGKEQTNDYKALLIDLMLCVEEYKQKFEIGRPQKKEELRPKEADDGLKYQIISGKGTNEELSKLLRRDVLS